MSNLSINKNSEAFDLNQKIIELKKEIEGNFIKLGAYLKEIRDKNLYKILSYETFEEYLGQPELSMNRSTVYSIIGVYEDFMCNQSDIKIEEIKEIGYSKLSRIRQFKSDPNFEEWIAKAKTLSLSDLGAEIRETKGITPKITAETTIEITCPHCGKSFNYRIAK